MVFVCTLCSQFAARTYLPVLSHIGFVHRFGATKGLNVVLTDVQQVIPQIPMSRFDHMCTESTMMFSIVKMSRIHS